MNSSRLIRLILSVAFLPLLTAFSCGDSSAPKTGFTLDRDVLNKDLRAIASEPHVFGSPRQKEVAEYIKKRITAVKGYDVLTSAFTAKVPNPALMDQPAGMFALHLEKSGQNLFGFSTAMKPGGCVILVASHYDSKRTKGFIYRGANDSGSSTAALLSLVDHWQDKDWVKTADCKPAVVMFDGEEAFLKNWYDGRDRHPSRSHDNTYGSRYEAGRLVSCQGNALCLPKDLGGYRVAALVLLDMIGLPNVSINQEAHSHAGLKKLALKLDSQLFPKATLFKNRKPMEVLDDHIPFIERGLPAINFIDFNNLQTWHRPGDDIETLSLDSIERVSALANALVKELSSGKIPN